MNKRAWFGSVIWVVGFNLFVAGVAYFWSISWAILILCMRHILLGVPKLYNIWRILIVGEEQYSQLQKINKDWPNRSWILETVIVLSITIASFIWINESVKVLLEHI